MVESWIFVSVFTCTLLWYTVLIKAYKKSDITYMCSWKREEHFNSLLESCGYSSLNLTSGSFLKYCDEESEVILINFLYLASLKSIALSCSLHESFTHALNLLSMYDFVTSCLDHLENIRLLNLQIFHMLTHLIR